MWRRFRSWWRRFRNKVQREENPLREFMYLDEVSVTSLLSSREGAIPSEITHTMSSTTRREATRGVESDLKVVKVTGGSLLESSHTSDRQVLRKATIQATFRDLYRGERGKLALSPIPAEKESPPQGQVLSLLRYPERNKESPWFIGPEHLRRGDLIEVEVELQADPIFRVSAFFSSFLDMITESEELAGQVDQTQAAKVREFNTILERLRVGLIPIRCRLIDYRAVPTAAGEYLIHRRALESIPAMDRPSSYPAYLVGVTEHDLYWKDTRRILFSNAEVRILCRLNKVGLQQSWNAVKLADMVGSLLPEFSDMMNSFGSDALQAMMSNPQGSGETEQDSEVLTVFAELIAERGGTQLDEAAMSEVRRIATENAHLLSGDLPEERVAFGRIADYLASHRGLTLVAEETARLRSQARSRVGLRRGLALQSSGAPPSSTTEAARFLDSEIIAIYW
ncbi:DUF6414 family protein [Streptomyces parvus]|uniref:DUF6414 family protein n=1 Tax=Streptomyces parvus TaxID=66428 RepID=UPI00406471CC